jgi:cytosine/adenosine deaminase-related metal-dependent hydrolase
MGYRKFLPSQIFTGYRLLETGNVLITDEHGIIQEIVPQSEAGDDLQQLDGILAPGFVNAHCHLELSHMKGLIPEGTGLVDFVFKVVTQRHFPEEEIAAAIDIAEQEMINNGIVAVGDICNNVSTLAQKEKGNLAYYNFIEVSGWLPERAQTRFQQSLAYYAAFEKSRQPTAGHWQSLSPHAPYSVSNELWALISPHFHNKTVTIHNQETAFEDSLFEKGEGDFIRMYELMKMDHAFFQPSGKSSVQTYFERLDAARQKILVHNTFTKERDIEYAIRNTQSANPDSSDVSWCLCVNANQYIEKALPPVDLLRKHNAAIVIGTDSLASNRSLSILDEIKTINRHFPHIPLDEILQWATLNGAKSLQMDTQLGSFEKGKKPGVVLIQQADDLQNSSVRRVI